MVCRPGPSAVTTASPLPERDSARSVQVPGRREEPEVARRRGDDLGRELAGAVQQPDERAADRLAAGQHAPGEHRLLGQVGAGRQGDRLVRCAAHQRAPRLAPSSIGTPMSEPYSVQLPS